MMKKTRMGKKKKKCDRIYNCTMIYGLINGGIVEDH
jgi:hypothetical protein